MASGAASLLCRAAAHALPGLHLKITAGPGAAETAGADGLNIAETFPEGRGSPHGCGLRAVFCKDAASARPEACRDKSKAPRSGDVAGRSPGVQGAPATGRPLCAPCARRGITQKTYRERHLPGNNTEQPFFRGETIANRKPYRIIQLRPSVGPRQRSAAGRSGSVPAAVPDGGINALSGYRLTPPRPTRQRRANVAYTGVTLASFASRVPR
ncbi:hypothetical protein SB6094_00949 [Klebsiella quasivariicola]|nr:hypothetical protein SB6094_00949 [Klebsiella quasivariicola]